MTFLINCYKASAIRRQKSFTINTILKIILIYLRVVNILMLY